MKKAGLQEDYGRARGFEAEAALKLGVQKSHILDIMYSPKGAPLNNPPPRKISRPLFSSVATPHL